MELALGILLFLAGVNLVATIGIASSLAEHLKDNDFRNQQRAEQLAKTLLYLRADIALVGRRVQIASEDTVSSGQVMTQAGGEPYGGHQPGNSAQVSARSINTGQMDPSA